MNLPKRTQERETSLLMHYLDNVFSRQFPFYYNHAVGKREWLLTLLTSTKSVYFATLSLSLLQITSTTSPLGSNEVEQYTNWHEEKICYYVLALQESQKLVQELNPVDGLEKIKGSIHAIAATIQLMSYESSNLTKGDWQVHLQAATSLVPVLATAWETVRHSSKDPSRAFGWIEPLDFRVSNSEIHGLYFEHICAMQFLTNVLVTFGILSSVSMGPTALSMDYRSLIDSAGPFFSPEELIGCREWVMSAILEIHGLDLWKRDEQANGRLSLKVFAQRGKSIEDIIETGICTIHDSLDNTDIITRIYATAALTYLHSVISGLNPDLQEIQESVMRTVILLQQIPDLRIVTSLAWPLCITGCMATDDSQFSFFENLVTAAGVTGSSFGNCGTAVEIIQETWKMRQGQQYMTNFSLMNWENLLRIRQSSILLI